MGGRPVLVEACGISPGQCVLDVATGTGNTAIRAAEAGADVVASDLTPENFEAGRREAEAQKVDGPRYYCERFKQTFGPVVATYTNLADDPERTAALDRDFLDFATRSNRGVPGGPAEYAYEYPLVVARKGGRRFGHRDEPGESVSPSALGRPSVRSADR